jgi:hypothetical protein
MDLFIILLSGLFYSTMLISGMLVTSNLHV